MPTTKKDPAVDGAGSNGATALLEAWDDQTPAGDVTATEAEPAPAPKKSRAKKTVVVSEPAAEAETAPIAITEPVAMSESVVEAEAVPVAVTEPVTEPAPKKARKRAAAPEVAAVTEDVPEMPAAPAAAEPKSMADLVAMAQSMATDEDDADTDEVVEAEAETPATDAAPAEAELPTASFARLGLSLDLLKSIAAVGYEEATPIQEMTIPVLLAGKDVIAQAQTGSGKTAAFGLPIIDAINPRDRHVQALVLCPTRELAIQVAEALHKYGRHKEVETLPIYGGQPYERQFRGLQRGPQIVVGTPGRVMDHMRRETLNLEHTKFFVLDEADEMLDMGFVEDIEWILQQVPEDRQTALFSATMPPRIAQLASSHMRNPERLTVAGTQMTVPETHQLYYEVPRMRKLDALTRILDAEAPPLAMIFCRTKLGVDDLGEGLLARGYQVETLHGDLSQAQRDRVMRRFRTGQADILIATDVAARGLDIANVTHVINFDIPESAEAYVHRIGRTGRAGRKGVAITLVTPRETRWLRQIERMIRAKIESRRLPTAADVAERRLELLKQQILEVVADETSYTYYSAIIDDLAEEHDATQIAAALMKLYADETGRGAPAEPAADDIALVNQPQPRQDRFEGNRGERIEGNRGGPRPQDGDNVRLFINVGRNVAVRPQDIVGAIANEAGVPGRAVGAIDIFESYSFVDVPGNLAERIIDALIRSGIKGRSVNAEIARPGDAPNRQDRGPRREFDRGYDRGPRRDGGGNYGGGGGGGGRYERDNRGPSNGNGAGGNTWNDRDREVRGNPAGGPPSFERNQRPDNYGNQRTPERPQESPRQYEQRRPRRDY